MMSDYEITVDNFIHLLKTQPDLFSKEENTKLVQLLNSQSDDVQSLSNAISDWCSEHPKIDDALAELDEDITERAPGSNQANPNIPRYQLDKRTLINVIQQSSATAKDEDKKNGKS